MANELKHIDIGNSLSKIEFEYTTLHKLNSQVAGDLIVATSSTQLSRLPIGTEGQILTLVAGEPAWATP